MANCMMGFPNRIDTATLSGGAWTTGLPRANLQNRTIGKVARTTNVALASTQFDIDQGATKATRVIALANHNISLAGRYRVRGGADPTFATSDFDSGWLDVWPVVYPVESLEWEDDNWWDGRYTSEQMTGYTTLLKVVLPYALTCRFWRIEIDDTTNPAGYVQIGRTFIGPAWQPQINMSYGASDAWETKTTAQEALSGAEYFDERDPFRVVRFTLDWLSQDEGMANAFEMDRRAGVSKEILWIFDPADTVHALRRSFLGRMRQLSPIEYPYFNTTKKAYELKELQ